MRLGACPCTRARLLDLAPILTQLNPNHSALLTPTVRPPALPLLAQPALPPPPGTSGGCSGCVALEKNTGQATQTCTRACLDRSSDGSTGGPAGPQHARQIDPTHVNPRTHAPDPPPHPPHPTHRRATAATRSSSAGPPRPRCRAWWAWAARPSRCRTTRRRTSCSRRCSRGRSRWVGGWVECLSVMDGMEGERSAAPDASALPLS